MPITPESTQKYERLQAFKNWMHGPFRTHCETEYGPDLFADFIFPYFDDFMECVEHHVEDLAEQSVQDEELMYDVEPEEIDHTEEDTND